MLVVIDGPMIERFINDDKAFAKCTDTRFNELDGDRDGLLKRDDLRWGLSVSEASDYDAAGPDKVLLEKFDVKRDGTIDRNAFRSMLAEIMGAVARGIGPMPVLVGVEEKSLMIEAYECELERVRCGLEAAAADGKLKDEEIKEIEMIKGDLKKKKSKKIFGIGMMCACSPKYLGED